MTSREILDDAAFRIAVADAQLLFRGSYVLGLWIGTHRRHCDDLDFLALYSQDNDRARTTILNALSQEPLGEIRYDVEGASDEVIFADSVSPGLRMTVPVRHAMSESQLQLDIAFNDPLPLKIQHCEVHVGDRSYQIPTPAPELAYAWKLHGLVEREGLAWRPKDLADLWLLQRHLEMDPERLRACIEVAFTSRDCPFWRLDRLVQRAMGASSGSRRRWAKLVREKVEGEYPSVLAEVVDEFAAFTAQVIEPLREEGPFTPPQDLRYSELNRLTQQSTAFRSYPWGTEDADVQNVEAKALTYVAERTGPKVLLTLVHAETNAKHREFWLRREARGLTLDCNDRVLARPYVAFERVEDLTDADFRLATVLEKLDGSLVFPTPVAADQCEDWVWRTKRGRSEIADSAGRHATASPADYEGLVGEMLRASQTPMFEWCSRSRWIVLDYPEDQLVLTGIRDNQAGTLWSYEKICELANRYAVPVATRLNVDVSREQWAEEVRSWTDREGCIIRLRDGRQFKLKSERYRWLHRAVEGVQRDRARWYLWATGAKDALLHCSRGREIELDDYVQQIEAACNKFAGKLRQDVVSFLPATNANRKRLALTLQRQSNVVSKLTFLAFEGDNVEDALRERIADACESEHLFRRIVELLDGPTLECC